MSFLKDPKGWARSQAERLRSDPKGWAKDRADDLRGMVDVAPFSDAALEKELAGLRERLAGADRLDAGERGELHDDLLSLHGRLTPGGAMVSGAKIGLAAAVLPVVGVITGPLIGSAYGVYRSQRLTEARAEVEAMLRKLAGA
jgi:hypothetical protein